MKRFLTLILALCLILCACGAGEPAPTTEAPTEEPTEAPTEGPVVYRNPLTGEEIASPIETRIFSFAVGNTHDAMPQYGLSKADIVWEIYANGYVTRLVAMFADVDSVESVGSIRSQRYPFTDLAQSYDAIACSAGGSSAVMSDVSRSGIDYLNVDTEDQTSYSYRDKDRIRSGYAEYHSLFAIGSGVKEYAVKKGIDITQDPSKTYGLNFAEEVNLNGDGAEKVTATFRLGGSSKTTTMIYNSEIGEYNFNQHGAQMTDGYYKGEAVTFKNVFLLRVSTSTDNDGYHISKIIGSGEGYFACNGQIVAIKWHRESDDVPFTFTLADGTPLVQGIGSSYIGFLPEKSSVAWE